MYPEPVLDFWGPYTKLQGGGLEWLWTNEGNAFIRVSLRLESRSRKALEKQSLSAARYAFISLFKSRARDFTTFTLQDLTDFYVERATAPLTIHYHSCFQSCWPNSKSKLKWNHLWEQGCCSSVVPPPWCFGGELRILCIQRIKRIGSGCTPLEY